MKHTDFARLLTTYFSEHLTVTRNLSPNTVSSYRDTFKLLLLFMRETHLLAPEMLEINALTSEIIIDFLNWLEASRKVSISTRNQRLMAIHAFFRYVQFQKPDILLQCQQILEIPKKKCRKTIVTYLSDDQLEILLKQPNTKSMLGRRDLTMLLFLYDTGARVQELIDLNVRDIRLDNPALAILTGKGQKVRQVPIMSYTVKQLSMYLNENGLNKPQCFDTPLFCNRGHERLTRAGIAFILKKYAQQSGNALSSVNVSPHVLRHTKAMHLLRAGINLVYIRDYLGHVDVSTTEIYARADAEMKRKALESVIPNYSTKDMTPWQNDKDLLEWLNSFGKKAF